MLDRQFAGEDMRVQTIIAAIGAYGGFADIVEGGAENLLARDIHVGGTPRSAVGAT